MSLYFLLGGNIWRAALLDQAVSSHQQAQASFATSTSEAKAQREGLELELMKVRQRLEQDAARLQLGQKSASHAQLQIESLEESLQSMKQQVGALQGV